MSLQLFTQFGIYPSSQTQGDFASATGGHWVYEINDGGTLYKVHEFTVGTHDFEVLNGGNFEYVIVGGGGGGSNDGGEGGSGGQVQIGNTDLSTGMHTVTVGAFGDGGHGSNGQSGSNSSVFGIAANGGGGGSFQSGNGSDGADGILSTITGDSIRYGAGGGDAGGPSGNEYGMGGITGGGDAADTLKSGVNFNVIAWKGLNGMGAGGGGADFTGSTSEGGAEGGYGRVIIRYEIGSLTNPVQHPVHPRPTEPATKWYGMWDSQNQFVGNVIKAQGISTARTMHESIGQPYSGMSVIGDSLGIAKDGSMSDSQIEQRFLNVKNDLHAIGSDNVYWILLFDEPTAGIEYTEKVIEIGRSTLNTDGQDFKFGVTYTYTRAACWGGTHDDDYTPIAGNLDYFIMNYYPFRNEAGKLDGSTTQSEFNDNFDFVIRNIETLIGPNTRIGITGQGFYRDDYVKPPDDMPNWLAAKVIAHPLVDGIIWWDWDDGDGVTHWSLDSPELSGMWTEVQNAYTTYFT